MVNKHQKEYTAKRVRKDIRTALKKIKARKDYTKIEQVYRYKRAIKEYYENKHSRISDNVLIEVYNTIYNPDIFSELIIGILSGLGANTIGDVINTNIPYHGGTNTELIVYIIAVVFLIVTVFLILFFLLFVSYKEILSIRSYNNEVDVYHRTIICEYIKKREAECEKKVKNESKHKRKN